MLSKTVCSGRMEHEFLNVIFILNSKGVVFMKKYLHYIKCLEPRDVQANVAIIHHFKEAAWMFTECHTSNMSHVAMKIW